LSRCRRRYDASCTRWGDRLCERRILVLGHWRFGCASKGFTTEKQGETQRSRSSEKLKRFARSFALMPAWFMTDLLGRDDEREDARTNVFRDFWWSVRDRVQAGDVRQVHRRSTDFPCGVEGARNRRARSGRVIVVVPWLRSTVPRQPRRRDAPRRGGPIAPPKPACGRCRCF
jgi:hypothetical protein